MNLYGIVTACLVVCIDFCTQSVEVCSNTGVCPIAGICTFLYALSDIDGSGHCITHFCRIDHSSHECPECIQQCIVNGLSDLVVGSSYVSVVSCFQCFSHFAKSSELRAGILLYCVEMNLGCMPELTESILA